MVENTESPDKGSKSGPSKTLLGRKKEEGVSSTKPVADVKPDVKTKRAGSEGVVAETTAKKTGPRSPSSRVAIRALRPDRTVVRNAPSGETYIWPRSGAVVEVAEEDVEHLMLSNHSEARGCCGGNRKRLVFERE